MMRTVVLAACCLGVLGGSACGAEAVTRKVLKTTTELVHEHGKTVVETHQTVRVTKAGKTTVIHTVSRKVQGVTAGAAEVSRTATSRTVKTTKAGKAPVAKPQVAKAGSVHGHVAHHEVAKRVVSPPPAPVAVAAAPAAPAPPPVDLAKGSDSGLPLPRFAALRSDQVSLRAGPGTRYPIQWVYQRRYLPVQIEREFEVWRLVEQADGTKGWVHEAMLTGRRGFLIEGDQPQTMRAGPADTAAAVAILKPGVVGRLVACPASGDWCQVAVKSYAGWLPRSAFWGTLPSEVVQQ